MGSLLCFRSLSQSLLKTVPFCLKTVPFCLDGYHKGRPDERCPLVVPETIGRVLRFVSQVPPGVVQ